LLLQSEEEILFLGRLLRKTADLGNDAQFMVFVRYCATEDYVEQFLFCCPLAEHTTRKGGRTQWTFVSFEHPLAHEERCWREWPTQWHRRVIKRTEP